MKNLGEVSLLIHGVVPLVKCNFSFIYVLVCSSGDVKVCHLVSVCCLLCNPVSLTVQGYNIVFNWWLSVSDPVCEGLKM